MRRMLVFFAVILVGCGVADAPAGGAAATATRTGAYPAPAAAPLPPGYPAPARVPTRTIDPHLRVLAVTKVAVLTAWADEEATARARPPRPERTFPPRPTELPITPRSLVLTPLAGGGAIVEDGQSTFGSARFLGGNRWVFKTDTKGYVVFAGEENHQQNTDNPRQGMLIVQTFDLATEKYTSTTFYRTPDRAGRAYITDALVEGSRMTLFIRTTTGVRYRFDVRSGAFEAEP